MDGRSFLKTDKLLPLGSSFNFEITPPDNEEPFHIKGTIKWINLYSDNRGMGIQFSFENPQDEERIQKLVLSYNID